MGWYTSIIFGVDTVFEQGDIIKGCPFYETHLNGKGELETDSYLYNAVVMTQSCDLENHKVDKVLLAPWKPLQAHFESHLEKVRRGNPDKMALSAKKKRSFFDNMRNSIFNRFHLLDRWPENGLADYPVVDFGGTFSIGLGELERIARKQGGIIRLNSPYKEHLSQSFARYFMRVGLPSNISNPF